MAMSCPEADRYLYLSGIGLLIALVEALSAAARRWPLARPGLTYGVSLLVVLWLVRTQLRIPDWYDNYNLWMRDAIANPGNSKAVAEVSVQFNARGDHAAAAEWARRALSADPDNALAVLQYAKAEHAAGRAVEALDFYERAIGLQRLHHHLESDAWLNYGMLLDDHLDRKSDAAGAYERSIQLFPSVTAALRLGVIKAEQGRLNEAIEVWRSALIWSPENELLKRHIAVANEKQQQAQ